MFFKTEYKLELKAIKDAAKDGIFHEALLNDWLDRVKGDGIA